MTPVRELARAAEKLCAEVGALRFSAPVCHVYNPLCYARPGYFAYLDTALLPVPKRVLFLGMNPGPFGMVQTGVPFGDSQAVRQWLRIRVPIPPPAKVHPKRPILGLDCPRCEISGQRLWGLFASRFANAQDFFATHFVLNYCPLAFLEESGRNRTPDKLPPEERQALFDACDQHLRKAVQVVQPEWIIGIGRFAFNRARENFDGELRLGELLHPSPASPAANRGWAEQATRQLQQLGIWH